MPKQPLFINFAQGLDTKTDPKQVPAGKFLSLVNGVFTTTGQLTKSNGFQQLPTLPQSAAFVTTLNDNLTAIGSTIQALSQNTNTWINKGSLQPCELSVLSLIRSDTNQSQVDTAISPNGLICTVYTDQTPTSLSTPRYMYAVADSVTGQNIIEPTQIIPSSGTVNGSPRVFVLDKYFIIGFSTSGNHLQYIAISTFNTNIITAPNTLALSVVSSPGLSWDGVVVTNSGGSSKLYFAYNTTSGGQGIWFAYLASNLTVSQPTKYTNAGKVTATLMSVSADVTGSSPIIYAAYYDSGSSTGYVIAVDQNLNKVIVTPAEIIASGTILNITSVAQNGVLTAVYEVSNNYGYDSSIPTHYLQSITCTQAGVVGSPTTILRSVGLASKAFIFNSIIYFLTAYQSPFQPSYFLCNLSGNVVSKLAYGNGGGYLTVGLPSVTLTDNLAQVGYLIKDFITSQNTSTTESITKSAIYSQTGVNLVDFTIGTSNIVVGEIAQALHLTGGFLWEYDGYIPVEHNFFVWPDSVEGTPINSGGAMVPQLYQYQVIYQWCDNQGNIHNSAPSIPITVDMSTNNSAFVQPTPLTPTGTGTLGSSTLVVSSATGLEVGQIITDTTNPSYITVGTYITKISGTTITLSEPLAGSPSTDSLSISSICSVTLNIPTLRLTYKTANPVKIAIYRFSVAQQEFFEVTSIQMPLINNTSVDYVTYTDTLADNQIIGNSLIYTTGGVVEDIGAPSFVSITLFDDRLWGIDAEDPNLLWYSKQVIETTPVEMSDLFTLYIAPSTGAQGSTGNLMCLFPMDDKLILFKQDAILYINGTGPDNTGANSQYSQPIFITSSVGTILQQSICMTDQGLMFQSDKGIWLLQRSGIVTQYIGAPVEKFTLASLANGANTIPATTQSRFTMDSGEILMYDYYFQQWGTFEGLNPISSTLYQSKQTIIDQYGRTFKEAPGTYQYGDNPVLMSLQTGWLNLAGIAGYQRILEFLLIGSYISPNQIMISVAYDYGNPIQSDIITPTNITGVYGSDSLYGQTSPYGGPGNLLQWRVHTRKQKCQVFQVTVQEIFNPVYGSTAGAGFTLSGILASIDVKKAFRPIKSAHSVG